jgi:hypothetical protein
MPRLTFILLAASAVLASSPTAAQRPEPPARLCSAILDEFRAVLQKAPRKCKAARDCGGYPAGLADCGGVVDAPSARKLGELGGEVPEGWLPLDPPVRAALVRPRLREPHLLGRAAKVGSSYVNLAGLCG